MLAMYNDDAIPRARRTVHRYCALPNMHVHGHNGTNLQEWIRCTSAL